MIVRQKFGTKYPKIKSRSIPDQNITSKTNLYYNSSNVLYQTDPGVTCLVKRQNESICYTGGMPGHTRQGANFCVHKKYLFHYTGDPKTISVTIASKSSSAKTEYGTQHVYGSIYHFNAEAEFSSASGVITGTGLLNSGAQGYANQTYLKLRPDLTKFSLPNDLLDFGQLKDLATLWRKGSSLVTNLAGARLNYKFGWVPLAGDLRALVDVVLHLREKVAKFKSQQGTIISSRCTLLNDSITKIGNVTVATQLHRLWRGQVDRKLHGYLVYQPLPLTVMSSVDETLRSIMDATGFELNPRIVWDKIPFSFVVDWFVNVGEFLESYKSDALELPINILQVFLQYKERIQVDSWTQWYDDASFTYRPAVSPGSSSVSSLFHRFPMMPDLATFALLKTKWPSLNQAVNLVSLGTTLNHGVVDTFGRKINKTSGKLLSYFDY